MVVINFGFNVSWFSICGLDGDWVCIFSNFGVLVDVFNFSFDYGVVVDLLVIDKVEVLCGVVVLFYGGNVVGGVVNMLDNCILCIFIDGLSGVVELCLGGVMCDCSGVVVLDGGGGCIDGGWGWYVDLFGCDVSD